MKSNEKNSYHDIINLPHHQSVKHRHMDVSDRAAQFSPFAALTGYEAAVEETARVTADRIELSEEALKELNEKLFMIQGSLPKSLDVEITYFVKDDKKKGGSYVTVTGVVKKIDEYERILVMEDKTRVPIEDIRSIRGAMFDRPEEA